MEQGIDLARTNLSIEWTSFHGKEPCTYLHVYFHGLRYMIPKFEHEMATPCHLDKENSGGAGLEASAVPVASRLGLYYTRIHANCADNRRYLLVSWPFLASRQSSHM